MKLYSNINIILFVWLISILFISYFGFLILPHSDRFTGDFLNSFSNWDGGHFLGIAQYGYSEKFQYVFFPLYPQAIKLLNHLTNNYLIAALLISGISVFLAMHLLYRLVSLDLEKKLAEKVILALIFFPTSFFFITAYSEGLFFFLVIATFYFLRQNKLFITVLFATLASATRLVGLALVLGVFIEILVTQGIHRKNWHIIFLPLGFLIYSWFLFVHTGDMFYFTIAEAHWQREISLPFVSFWQTIKNLSTPGFVSNNFIAFLDLIFTIFGLGLSIRSFRFLPISFSVYSLTSILLPLFTGSLGSMPRFLLPIFPIFILVGLNKNKFIDLSYQMISIMLLAVFTILFINGYWVS